MQKTKTVEITEYFNRDNESPVEIKLDNVSYSPRENYTYIRVCPMGTWLTGEASHKVITKHTNTPRNLFYYNITDNKWVSSIFEASMFPGDKSDDEVLNYLLLKGN